MLVSEDSIDSLPKEAIPTEHKPGGSTESGGVVSRRALNVAAGQLNSRNIGQLKRLLQPTLPIAYSPSFFTDALKHHEHCILGYLSDIVVAAVCGRVLNEDEDVTFVGSARNLSTSTPSSSSTDQEVHGDAGGESVQLQQPHPSPHQSQRPASSSHTSSTNATASRSSSTKGGQGVGVGRSKGEQPNPNNKLYITALAVLAPYRNFGIGTQLLIWLLDKASHSGVKTVVLHVHSTNDKAISLYRRMGFRAVQTVEGYYPRLDPPDALLLTRTLPLDAEEDRLSELKGLSLSLPSGYYTSHPHST